MAKKYSYWISSGKYSLLQKVFVMGFGILSFMVLARALSPAQLGVWGLFLIISSIVETLRNSLIRNGYVLFMHTRPESDHPGIEYAAIMTNIVYTILFTGLFLAMAPFVDAWFNAPGLAGILRSYCLVLLVLVPFSYLEIFFVTKLDFRAVFWMYFVRNGLMFAGFALFGLGGFALLSYSTLISVYGVTALAGTAAGIFLARRHTRIPVAKTRRVLPDFLAFGKFVFANNLFSLVFRSVDSFMTASFIGPAASAFYSTSARITNLVDVPSQVFADIMFPKAAQVRKENEADGLKRIYEKTVAATLTFTLPAILLISIFPSVVVRLLAGESYLEAAPVLQIIVFYGLFLPFIKQFGNIMDVLHKPQINSVLMLVFASLNVGLNAWFIHLFGLYGSATATLLSYCLLFTVTQVILRRHLRVSLVAVGKNVLEFYPAFFDMAWSAVRRKGRGMSDPENSTA